MTIERDNRQPEADRQYAEYVRQGYDPESVAALLPALVGPERAAITARSWLTLNARLGHDLSDEGQAEQLRVMQEANEFLGVMLDEGLFDGSDLYDPGEGTDRYAPYNLAEAVAERWPDHGYPAARENAERLGVSDLDREGDRLIAMDDDTFDEYLGNLGTPQWTIPGE
jgi:hypothetical protein